MNQEAVRRQYLDAMGITTLASRYCLPNALETPACEWEQASPQAPVSHSQRLHALLDDAQQAEADRRTTPPEPAANPASLKALLDEGAPQTEPPPAPPEQALPVSAPEKPRQPLTFTLSCLCLGGRWLSLHGGELTVEQRSLLANAYRAAGIPSSAMSAWQTFTWPPLADGPAAQEPLLEAQEGLSAFIRGTASRNGWAPTRVLWWAGDDISPLARVLAGQEEGDRVVSQTLSLPLWQGPDPASLLSDGTAKRRLWPSLVRLGEAWREEQASE